MNFSILAFFALIAAVFVVNCQKCTEEEQCGEDECCQRLTESQIYSKRALKLVTSSRFVGGREKVGTCQPYRKLGETCVGMAARNGYCSCAPGLACVTEMVPINSTKTTTATDSPVVGKRSLLKPPKGYYSKTECVVKMNKG